MIGKGEDSDGTFVIASEWMEGAALAHALAAQVIGTKPWERVSACEWASKFEMVR